MKARGDESMTATVETNRRCEVIEMHLFGENASRERALRGAASAADGRRSASDYLEDPLAAIRLAPSARGARPW